MRLIKTPASKTLLHSNHQGFSLVELSIVLVILGLLTGGILAGRDMIIAAELRAVTTELNQWKTAVNTFKGKYFALPGDMRNATDFWGIAGGTGSDNTCYIAPSTSAETCNGDGNGGIDGSSPQFNERYRVWQHLANAKLINGIFIGTMGINDGYTAIDVPNINVPRSRLSNDAYWSTSYYTGSSGNSTSFGFPRANGMILSSTNIVSGQGSLTPEETWNIDRKIDDGLPGTGKLRVFKGDGSTFNCTSAGGVAPPADAGATYNLASTEKVCLPTFLME
jgi:prepilin-type N-terminal cleavage/methylation domain-containing protein